VICDGVLYDPSKVKVTEVRNLRKWSISKSISSAGMHVIKRLKMNCDTPSQYLNFDWTDFLIFILIRRHVLVHLWQTNFASYEESTGSPVRSLFINLCLCLKQIVMYQ